MRLLLDECVPRPLKRDLVGHQVSTVPDMGWSSKRNSELLGLVRAHRFDAFLTVDQNVSFQQNLQAAQGQLNQLKDKLNKLGSNGGGDMDMPDFKPNQQKTKTFGLSAILLIEGMEQQ